MFAHRAEQFALFRALVEEAGTSHRH
jgi:hypothetical protein